MRLLHCALFFLALSAAVPAFISVYVAHATTHPPWYVFTPGANSDSALPAISPSSKSFRVSKGKVTNPGVDFGFSYQNVSFESTRPGLTLQPTLRGWYVPADKLSQGPDGVKIGIIAVHGGGRDRREFLSHLDFWHRAGFDALLYDSSDHGVSDGTGVGLGFGHREQYDCAGAARFAKHKLGWDKIVVMGTSVGASAALLATAREPIIDGVIAENPFYDYEPFFVKIYGDILGAGSFGGRDASRYGSLVSLVTALTNYIPLETFIGQIAAFTRWWIGAAGQVGPVHVIASISPRPLLLIHGKADSMIPTSHSIRLYEEAKEPKEIWLPENGQHADVLGHYPEEYMTKVIKFVRSVAAGGVHSGTRTSKSSNNGDLGAHSGEASQAA